MTPPKSTYSPAEICEMFGISKTTLFRWEEEGKISPVMRKINQVREYTKQHVKEIAQMRVKDLNELYIRAVGTENVAQMSQVHADLTRIKVLYLEDVTGLVELAQQNNLPDETIRELLKKALEVDPRSRLFVEIISLLCMHTKKQNS